MVMDRVFSSVSYLQTPPAVAGFIRRKLSSRTLLEQRFSGQGQRKKVFQTFINGAARWVIATFVNFNAKAPAVRQSFTFSLILLSLLEKELSLRRADASRASPEEDRRRGQGFS